jgi:hypothetical protein
MGTPSRTIQYRPQWYVVEYFDSEWDPIPDTRQICHGLEQVTEAIKMWNDLREGRLLFDEVSNPHLIHTAHVSITTHDEFAEVEHGEA